MQKNNSRRQRQRGIPKAQYRPPAGGEKDASIIYADIAT